jgi:Flp pilus assembly pilin Flp
MKQFLLKLWHDEEGAETAEWLVIAAVLVVIATGVYQGDGLEATLEGLVGYIAEEVPGDGAVADPAIP